MTVDHDFLGPDDERPARRAHEIFLRSVDWNQPTKCRSCGAHVYWATTQKNGRPILLNGNARRVVRPTVGGTGLVISSDHVHFATCPHSAEHRRNVRTAPSERID